MFWQEVGCIIKKKGVNDPLQYEASKLKYKWLMNEYKI